MPAIRVPEPGLQSVANVEKRLFPPKNALSGEV